MSDPLPDLTEAVKILYALQPCSLQGEPGGCESCRRIASDTAQLLYPVFERIVFDNAVVEIASQRDAALDALRAVMELHRGQVEDVEWFDAPDETGKAEVCPSCRPAEPTEWNPPRGFANLRPKGFVASYVLSPCPTLKALAAVWADHPSATRVADTTESDSPPGSRAE